VLEVAESIEFKLRMDTKL